MKEATITRVFDVPRERVWRCLTEPAAFAAWFGTPPFTTSADRVTIDLRPGGEFRATMVHETEGTELPFLGRYLEVAEPERIVHTLDNVDDPDDPDVEVLTYTLADLGDGRTELTYHQVGHLPDGQYEQIEQGVAGFYDRLAAHLAGA
jgi:uncharacterized protein YndB with AHSA1/START domain